MTKLKPNVKNAILIGSLCSVSYLAVYFARNILSAVSPQMLAVQPDLFTEEYIGDLSALYFVVYAIGQLINGIIGDKIKAKYMISLGLFFAGIASIIFPLIADLPGVAPAAYASTGFFLAMIYGPMTKVVSENTEPIYATRCSLGYTFAAFFGSPLAGMTAAFLAWQQVFTLSSIILIAMSVCCFCFFTVFEKKGIVKYGQYQHDKTKGGSIQVLFRHRIVKFALISIITGVIRTSVVFWLPTYINQHLGFSPDHSAMLFTLITLIISASAFISVSVYEALHRNMDLTILLMFSISSCAFLGVYFLKDPTLNLIFLLVAVLASNCSATMLWSRYCPSLRDTGMVSGATGFLDFLSYMAAALSSKLFANAVSVIGWSNLILIWMALMVFGVIISLPYHAMKRSRTSS